MVRKIISLYINRKWKNIRLKISREMKELESYKRHENQGDEVVVTAIQRKLIVVNTVEEYLDMMEKFVIKAAEKNSDIIAFPEYNMLDLFGLLPGFHSIHHWLRSRQEEDVAFAKGSQEEDVLYDKQEVSDNGSIALSLLNKIIRYLFRVFAQPSREIVLEVLQYLAAKYNIYIYTGSYFLVKDGKVYNAGSLIDRSGKIIGTQKKLHLTDFEDDLHLSRGVKLEVFPLDFGKVAIPVCMDGTYFETFYLAKNLGADIVILPIANNEEYDIYKAMRGIWSRVLETPIVGVKPALNGWLGHIHFTGKAGIFVPPGWGGLERQSFGIESGNSLSWLGVFAIASEPEGDEIITASLDLNELHKLRDEMEYGGDVNCLFEKKLFEKYEEIAQSGRFV